MSALPTATLPPTVGLVAWLALAPPILAGPQGAGQGDWTIYRGDPGLSGIADCELPAELELLWSYDCGEPVVSSPVVRGGRVYVGADDGNLHAIDFESGAAVWSFATEDMIEAPPLVRGELVYVGSTDGHLYAVDAESGEERWRFRGEDKFVGSANWLAPEGELPGRVVAGCYDNRLYCLDAGSGEQLWSYETDNYINGTPAVTGGRVVFGGCDAVLHVVDGRTGEAAARVDLGAECYVAGSTAAVDGRAYLGHYGNAFVCVDLESGEEVWRLEDERHAFFSAPAVGAERVVFGGRNKQVHCVDRATGEVRWRFPTRRKVDGSPVIAGDKVIVGSGDGRLYLLDLASGEELWSYEVGRSISSSPAVTGGRVVVGADDGQIYCFGAPQAPKPEPEGSKR